MLGAPDQGGESDDESGFNAVGALETAEMNKERVRILLDRYGLLFRELLQRDFLPRKRIKIETINGEPAAGSVHAAALTRQFDAQPDGQSLTLYRKV